MSKSVLVTAAASGVLSLIGGQAHADAVGDSTVSNSPGVVSGNSAQVPVHVPVNICGNTANVIGLLNPAFGNKCANESGTQAAGGGGASADSAVSHSPGVASGNNAQVPVHVPVNFCGNTIDALAGLNPAFGNECTNESGAQPAGTNGASADSAASHSPGVVSGNSAQVPVHVPVNVCGNTADLVAALNPAFGNECANGTPTADQPPADEPPADEPPADEPPADEPPADEPPADEPPADEPPADEPPADEPPADEPPADEPPSKPTTPSKPKPTKPTKPTTSKPKPAKPAAKPTGKPHGKPIG